VPFTKTPPSGARGVFVAPTLGSEVSVEIPDSYDEEDPPPLTKPTPTTFREVNILAEGAQTAGVQGLQPGDWVVTVGQNLLSTAGEERVDARVRPMSWSRLLSLQRMQDTDLLRRFMSRQQRLADQRFGNGDTTKVDTAKASVRSTASQDG
jgi:hypothetical protein